MTSITTRITETAVHAQTRVVQLQDQAEQILKNEDGFLEDLPWKGILMVGGAVAAVTLLAFLTGWMNSQLAAIPSN